MQTLNIGITRMTHLLDIRVLIKQYEDKIIFLEEEYKSKITKYKNAIEALKELPEFNETTSNISNDNDPNALFSNVIPIITLREKVVQVLSESNCPLTSRDVMNSVNDKYKDKHYSQFSSWSGPFSHMYSKENSGIRKFELPEMPSNLSAFYCLSEWFDESGLKEDYRHALSVRYGIRFDIGNII